MRQARLWAGLFGVDKTVVESVVFDEDEGCVLARVRPARGARGRCGLCLRRCARYDGGQGPRRWRALDLGPVQAWLVAEAPRVSCREHGVVVAHVPWARHGAGHTRGFDQTVAWLATVTSKTAVTELMRIAWRTVGSIITRVWADIEAVHDRFDGLRRIGIDEISYRRGHKYLTVVIDHDSGRLVWAAPGRDKATVAAFFDALGPQRSAALTHISADQAQWIADVVAERAPNAVRCADAFHIVAWATTALDEVRRQAWNRARKIAAATEPKRGRGRPRKDAPPRPASATARQYRGARWALLKNPATLTTGQRTALAWIALNDPELFRAYRLKEALRLIFQMPYQQAVAALDAWIGWARRCRIPAFVKLQRSIVVHRASILAAIEHGLSNARTESANTKIRLITRIAFGFGTPQALIALAMLNLGGHRPALPGRR